MSVSVWVWVSQVWLPAVLEWQIWTTVLRIWFVNRTRRRQIDTLGRSRRSPHVLQDEVASGFSSRICISWSMVRVSWSPTSIRNVRTYTRKRRGNIPVMESK
ncbi:hypothetical protein F4820DRAFT_410354 [Hypoxylon rubiginosum]|uniref:Uncharacterized protein n=1 Tax=Hypoxylon rubiginosum TaxID=110542 RepID=A0ACB9ZAS9_9PEZI|nr:hypothetical protein F4820DRAFT_410354 [Hypoxylon rubiginosum]